MKVLAVFALLISAIQGHRSIQVIHNIRGGASIGPLDAGTALKLSKAAATAYVAGSASKYINSQTGQSNSQVRTYKDVDVVVVLEE